MKEKLFSSSTNLEMIVDLVLAGAHKVAGMHTMSRTTKARAGKAHLYQEQRKIFDVLATISETRRLYFKIYCIVHTSLLRYQ